jgi:VpsR domain
VEEFLQGALWDVNATTDMSTAHHLIDRLPAEVGVARLEPDEFKSIRPYVELVETTQTRMPWVALVASEALERASVREAIANLFFDYHTLPVGYMQIVANITTDKTSTIVFPLPLEFLEALRTDTKGKD